jgi:hypothetical protein
VNAGVAGADTCAWRDDGVAEGTGGELVAAAEHAVTARRRPTATGITGKRAERHMLFTHHRVEVPSL